MSSANLNLIGPTVTSTVDVADFKGNAAFQTTDDLQLGVPLFISNGHDVGNVTTLANSSGVKEIYKIVQRARQATPGGTQ